MRLSLSCSAGRAINQQEPGWEQTLTGLPGCMPFSVFPFMRRVAFARAKQPFAVAMQDRVPFAIGGLWENWRHPQSGEWIRTVAIITVPSNELVAQIHDRMPLILPKAACERWLGGEPDPHHLLGPFPAELMVMAGLDARQQTGKRRCLAA
jgi:putative SOS response-associated peptidase YedK